MLEKYGVKVVGMVNRKYFCEKFDHFFFEAVHPKLR